MTTNMPIPKLTLKPVYSSQSENTGGFKVGSGFCGVDLADVKDTVRLFSSD